MSEQILTEQQQIKDALNHPGTKLLFQKLDALVEIEKVKQLECNPHTEAGVINIIRIQQFRYVVKEFLPGTIEGLVNYDPNAPDRQVPKKWRFKIMDWLRS